MYFKALSRFCRKINAHTLKKEKERRAYSIYLKINDGKFADLIQFFTVYQRERSKYNLEMKVDGGGC